VTVTGRGDLSSDSKFPSQEYSASVARVEIDARGAHELPTVENCSKRPMGMKDHSYEKVSSD